MFYFSDMLVNASDVEKQPILEHGDVNKMQSILVVCQHVIGDVLGSMFGFGDDVLGNTSDLDQPMVCVHIQYGDVLDSMFYFGDVFGSMII